MLSILSSQDWGQKFKTPLCSFIKYTCTGRGSMGEHAWWDLTSWQYFKFSFRMNFWCFTIFNMTSSNKRSQEEADVLLLFLGGFSHFSPIVLMSAPMKPSEYMLHTAAGVLKCWLVETRDGIWIHVCFGLYRYIHFVCVCESIPVLAELCFCFQLVHV